MMILSATVVMRYCLSHWALGPSPRGSSDIRFLISRMRSSVSCDNVSSSRTSSSAKVVARRTKINTNSRIAIFVSLNHKAQSLGYMEDIRDILTDRHAFVDFLAEHPTWRSADVKCYTNDIRQMTQRAISFTRWSPLGNYERPEQNCITNI